MRQIAKATPQLLPDISAKVWAKRTLPAAEAPQGDAEVVQRLLVGLVRQARVSRGRVGEVA